MDDCFICCSLDGKSTQEKLMEITFNKKTHSYPLVKLSQAYGCGCVGNMAHNKCLLGINKCPTCRKQVPKPNLYVQTCYDYWFGIIFIQIKKNPRLIYWTKIFGLIGMMILFGLGWLIDKKFILIQTQPTYSTHITMGLLILIQFIGAICFIMDDYFKKYWLYDEKNNRICSL